MFKTEDALEICRRQGDENVSDCKAGEAMAAAFVANYQPHPTDGLLQRAAQEITDTLAKAIPGCLTGNQVLDDDVQALVFAVTAEKHGWSKRS